MNGEKHPLGPTLLMLYKGIWGSLETFVGLLLILASLIAQRVHLSAVFRAMIARELTEDPQDSFTRWILAQAPKITYSATMHLALILVLLGLLKIIIAASLWYRSMALRDLSLLLLAAATIFAMTDLYARFSLAKCLLLLVDLVILYYLWRILPAHLKPKEISKRP